MKGRGISNVVGALPALVGLPWMDFVNRRWKDYSERNAAQALDDGLQQAAHEDDSPAKSRFMNSMSRSSRSLAESRPRANPNVCL